jgi:hypothetical protein
MARQSIRSRRNCEKLGIGLYSSIKFRLSSALKSKNSTILRGNWQRDCGYAPLEQPNERKDFSYAEDNPEAETYNI